MSGAFRLLPALAFPGRAFTPGETHPAPAHENRSQPLDPCQCHWHGWDLLLHGYPWEAHEAWETVWRASCGPSRSWVQGLIRLAAALCKAREKNWPAIEHHLAGALCHWAAIPDGQVPFHQVLNPIIQEWLGGPARDQAIGGWREQTEHLKPGNPGPILLPDHPGACHANLLTGLRVLFSQTASDTGF